MELRFNTHEGILCLNETASGQCTIFHAGKEYTVVGDEFSIQGKEFSLLVKPSTAKKNSKKLKTTSGELISSENMPKEQKTTSEGPCIDYVQTSLQEDNFLKFALSDKGVPLTEGNIKKYIQAKGNVYDYMELQEHFLGRVLHSNSERFLYKKFTDMVRKVATEISKEENGVWKTDGFRKTENNGNTKVNKLVKLDA